MAQTECLLPISPPVISPNSHHQLSISFRHPAYHESANDLLCLGAVDYHTVRGINYDVALVACGIVAGNKWHHAWFGEKCDQKGGYQCVPRPDNGILPYKKSPYYFFVNQDTKYKYPVVPSFEHWPFPHGDLPDAWKRLSVGSKTAILPEDPQRAIASRDQRCRITGYAIGTGCTHLIPAVYQGWFGANRMRQYCQAGGLASEIDDRANTLLLRRDLRFLFDEKRFVMVPRGHPPTPTIHVLSPDTHGELQSLYQSRPLQPILMGGQDVAPEFLFARFAWALFCDKHYSLLKSTLLLGDRVLISEVKYRVSIFDAETGGRHEKDMTREALDRDIQIWSQDHTNSRKRRRGGADESSYNGDSDELDENDFYWRQDGSEGEEAYGAGVEEADNYFAQLDSDD
ncbi:hypothetical protein ANO14919_036050 [Xylariales sp. No.14919]|nr:hypothetical protein ANO14919_036050 [Xylariales sp. No.14919]